VVRLVTLEKAAWGPAAEPLFLEFVNSLHWDDGIPMEELEDAAALAAWCAARELPAEGREGELGALRSLREHARAIVERLATGRPLVLADLQAIGQVLGGPTGRLSFMGGNSGQPSLCFEPEPGHDGGVAFRVALSLTQFLVAGEHGRLKLCANPGCGYAFLDFSTNRTRRWCDMSGCGNRQKVRSFRRRRTLGPVRRRRS